MADMNEIMRPAFAVHGAPDFDRGPPADAMEYLRRVRYQAERLPQVVVSEIDRKKVKVQTSYMPKISYATPCSDEAKPLPAFENEIASDFANLRQAVTRCRTLYKKGEVGPWNKGSATYPKNRDEKGWVEFCLGSKSRSPERPHLRHIMRMDHVSICTALRAIISRVDTIEGIGKSKGEWLFALMATLEKPIDAQMASFLRSLYRKCAELRAASYTSKGYAAVAKANIILILVAKVFGQKVIEKKT